MGEWTQTLAAGEEDVAELLGSLPGPMCPRIDEWVGKRGRYSWRTQTTLSRRNTYTESDLDTLYQEADAIQDERNTAVDGLEECRSALEAIRSALERMTDAYREQRDARAALEAKHEPEAAAK